MNASARSGIVAACTLLALACAASGTSDPGAGGPAADDAGAAEPIPTPTAAPSSQAPSQPAACAAPKTTCGTACVDVKTDPTTFGACGTSCNGAECVTGECMAPDSGAPVFGSAADGGARVAVLPVDRDCHG